jgi:hypothetical protein
MQSAIRFGVFAVVVSVAFGGCLTWEHERNEDGSGHAQVLVRHLDSDNGPRTVFEIVIQKHGLPLNGASVMVRSLESGRHWHSTTTDGTGYATMLIPGKVDAVRYEVRWEDEDGVHVISEAVRALRYYRASLKKSII